MREYMFVGLQAIAYLTFLVWLWFTILNVYTSIQSKELPAEVEEQPVQTDYPPLYIISPRKE